MLKKIYFSVRSSVRRKNSFRLNNLRLTLLPQITSVVKYYYVIFYLYSYAVNGYYNACTFFKDTISKNICVGHFSESLFLHVPTQPCNKKKYELLLSYPHNPQFVQYTRVWFFKRSRFLRLLYLYDKNVRVINYDS